MNQGQTSALFVLALFNRIGNEAQFRIEQQPRHIAVEARQRHFTGLMSSPRDVDHLHPAPAPIGIPARGAQQGVE